MSDLSLERPLMRLLNHYRLSHQHPRNESIHILCVPSIVWSLLALCWLCSPPVTIAGVVLALAYYCYLSLSMALGMLLMSATMLLVISQIPADLLAPVALGVFVLAWIGQFIGHKIEGKKPSFFEDIRYLLIGPLFVLEILYRRMGWSY